MQTVAKGRLHHGRQRLSGDLPRPQQPAASTSSRYLAARPQRPRGCHSAARLARALSAKAPEAATFTLDNGLELRHFTLDELNFLYREVFQERVYLRHGVTIRPGDTVVDVGANSGLFTLLAAEEAGPAGRVVALEPLGRTFALLRRNVEAHAGWCAARGKQVATPLLLNCGAGAPGQDTATFVSYSDSASGWSTMYPDDGEVADNMARYIQNLMEGDPRVGTGGGSGGGGAHGGDGYGASGRSEPAEASSGELQQQQQQHRDVDVDVGEDVGVGVPEPALASMARLLWRGAPPLRPLLRAAGWLYVRRMLWGQRRWRCALLPLSRVIREQRLERVDLLKVDVERAELDVLNGISPEDWPRVRQVVMEVHDTDGRLSAVRELLAGAGFSSVVSEQEPGLAGSTLHMLYAVRGPQAG